MASGSMFWVGGMETGNEKVWKCKIQRELQVQCSRYQELWDVLFVLDKVHYMLGCIQYTYAHLPATVTEVIKTNILNSCALFQT